MKLNIGCGTDPREGWVNLDYQEGPGVDIVHDLEAGPLPFDDDSAEEILGIHVIEHIANPLPLMQELYRVAAPDAILTLACPYGASDDAWEDPTHVRPYFAASWVAFGQPYHWRSAGYGYTADWDLTRVEVQVPRQRYDGVPTQKAITDLYSLRNVAVQQIATLEAVKPARPRDRALLEPLPIVLSLVDV